MMLQEACRMGRQVLEKNRIEDASLDAWYLLEYVTGINRACYLADPDSPMEKEQERRYFTLIEKRAQRIPLQHLTGVQEFMGLDFMVNEHVLIPRQDTETLVEKALEILRGNGWWKTKAKESGNAESDQGQTGGSGTQMRLLDMCTGSGCILLSIIKSVEDGSFELARNNHPFGRYMIQGIGVDISGEALKVAKANAEHLGIRAEFLQSDLFSEVSGQYEMIVSNPPYIRTSVIEELQKEVKEHDPIIALDGKEDGLYFYREIIRESVKYLVPGGYLLFEIGYDQADDVSAMMKQSGFQDITVKKDLAGLDRVVSGVYYQIGDHIQIQK